MSMSHGTLAAVHGVSQECAGKTQTAVKDCPCDSGPLVQYSGIRFKL